MRFCSYYQAHATPDNVWFVAGILRNEANIVFDRSLDAPAGLLEFFVPVDQEKAFDAVVKKLEHMGSLFNVKKLPNRLQLGEPL